MFFWSDFTARRRWNLFQTGKSTVAIGIRRSLHFRFSWGFSMFRSSGRQPMAGGRWTVHLWSQLVLVMRRRSALIAVRVQKTQLCSSCPATSTFWRRRADDQIRLGYSLRLAWGGSEGLLKKYRKRSSHDEICEFLCHLFFVWTWILLLDKKLLRILPTPN